LVFQWFDLELPDESYTRSHKPVVYVFIILQQSTK
jgi:hypothetical protein